MGRREDSTGSPRHAGRHESGRRYGRERTRPVRPGDAAPVMPHVSREAVPAPIADEGEQVNAVRTRKAPRHRGARTVGIVIAVVVVLAAIGGAAAFISYQMGAWGDVEVPDVMGMDAAKATAALEDAGFEAEAFDQKSDGGYGTVVSMDPSAGESVRHGSSVRIGIGTQRLLPDVVGMKPEAARQALAQAGATGEIAVEYRISLDAEEDTIVSMEPEAGSVFRSSDPITLYVARALKVPDVKGMQQDEACAAIEELGLQTQVEWRESSQEYPTVLETDPLPGTRVDEGATVTVYVANGGPEDRWHMIDYMQSSPSTDAEYLSWQNWEFQFSEASGGMIGTELWQNGNQDLFFGSDPWAFATRDWWDSSSEESALAAGAGFHSVRMNFSDLSDGAADEKTVRRYMDICGFDNPQDTCTDGDISLPSKRKFDSGGIARVCTYGVTDGCTWVILLKSANDGAVDVSLVAMDDDAVARLTADGGSVCDMFMYRDAYPNGQDDEGR